MADAASINGIKLVAIGFRAAKILDVESTSSTVIPSKDFINPDICSPNTSPGFLPKFINLAKPSSIEVPVKISKAFARLSTPANDAGSILPSALEKPAKLSP